MTKESIENRIKELEKDYEKSVETLKDLETKFAIENEHRIGILASISELQKLLGGEENGQ